MFTADMIAPCGLDCSICSQAQIEENPCPGCNGPNENKPEFCSKRCGIILCQKRRENGYKYCDECSDFPCEDVMEKETRYTSQYPVKESPLKNLQLIREMGMEAFLKQERQQWTCEKCGKLNEGIKHLIDGNAVIIMGAGASYGAKNSFGDFPSGSMLAKKLYALCDITPDDENDLQDAAQCYEEKFGATDLIQQVRSLLTCASFTESHETIYSQPWLRYYTTNYDDVAELAAKKHNILLIPVTLSSNFREYHEKDHLCVHINGHIGRLDKSSLHHEFKLTSNSYLSQTSIVNSQWGDLLNNDLETAKCIVILGLSLKYDLDLSKIIFNANFTDKTLVISAPDLSRNAENRLKRYGTVYKIGVDGFAAEIDSIKKKYVPQEVHPTERLYTAFTYEYRHKYKLISPTPDDVFRMLLSGQYSDSLFHKSKGQYDGIVC